MRNIGSPLLLLLIAILALSLCQPIHMAPPISGGLSPVPNAQNNTELEDLAKFAVQEHNTKQNSTLEYVSLVSAQQQVVAGIMYYLDLEAKTGGSTKLYEAKVWVKPWQNFKSLESFQEKAQ